ncbi:hypothetical protein [Vibrio makurazakiensis]
MDIVNVGTNGPVIFFGLLAFGLAVISSLGWGMVKYFEAKQR